MEAVDRAEILRVIWPAMNRVEVRRDLGEKRTTALLKMVAEGYSFPTNLDNDPPPAGGVSRSTAHRLEGRYICSYTQHCPETQLEMALRASGEGWDDGKLRSELDRMDKKRLP
jgi:hypothetical protein